MQTLGNTISAPGAAGPRQVLRLGRRDEREGQTIFVDLATLPTFRRFFVFAYGQHGSPDWGALRPQLDGRRAVRRGAVDAPRGRDRPVRGCAWSPRSTWCRADLVVRRENDFVDRHAVRCRRPVRLRPRLESGGSDAPVRPDRPVPALSLPVVLD